MPWTNGSAERRELARLVGAGHWGPDVFCALREALDERDVRRLSRTAFAARHSHSDTEAKASEGPGWTVGPQPLD
jgi:hypothetical protein